MNRGQLMMTPFVYEGIRDELIARGQQDRLDARDPVHGPINMTGILIFPTPEHERELDCASSIWPWKWWRK